MTRTALGIQSLLQTPRPLASPKRPVPLILIHHRSPWLGVLLLVSLVLYQTICGPIQCLLLPQLPILPMLKKCRQSQASSRLNIWTLGTSLSQRTKYPPLLHPPSTNLRARILLRMKTRRRNIGQRRSLGRRTGTRPYALYTRLPARRVFVGRWRVWSGRRR